MARGNVRVSITGDAAGLARETRAAERHLGNFSRNASKGMKNLGGAAGVLDSRLGKLAKAASLVGAGYLAIAEAKDAINTTVDLGKATIGLNKNLGISVRLASEWAAVAKVRGIETKALNMSFGTLSKQIDAATQGTEASITAFERLGVTQKELKNLGFQGVLTETADGFQKLKDGPIQTATAMRLFGRGWQTVVPILRDGSRAMNEQLNLAKKYGATFSGGTIKSVKDLIQAQREAKFATLGLQVAFGTSLAPALAKVIPAVARFINELRTGHGASGRLSGSIRDVADGVGRLIRLITRNKTVLTVLVATLGVATAAWAAYRVTVASAAVATTIATGGLNLIIPALAALAAGIAIAYTKSERFRNIVRSVGNVLADAGRIAGGVASTAFHTLKDAVELALKPLRTAYNILKKIADIAGKVGGVLGDVGGAFKSLGNAIPIGSGQAIEEFFGQFSPFTGPLGGMGAKSVDAFTPIASRFGLMMTSGFRKGDKGWHGANRARDYSDGYATPEELHFAQFMAKTYGGNLLELIHTPLGFGIKNGKKVPLSFWGSKVNADHFDHVHVALQRGGQAFVPGTGDGDKVPAMLEPGEFVVNRNAARAAGPMLEALNRSVPRFQNGGGIPLEYRRLMRIAMGRYGVPANIQAGLIDVESSWNPNAVSPAGAFGLTQFMPSTAAGYGVKRGAGHSAVASQILGMAHYLVDLGFRSDRRGALAKYNGGPGNPQYGYADAVLAAAAGYSDLDLEDTTNGGRNTSRRRRARVRRGDRYGVVTGGGPEGVSNAPKAGAGGFFGELGTYADNKFGAGAALAALTEGNADDLANARAALEFFESWLPVAIASGDPNAIQGVAGAVKQWRDEIANLTQATNDLAEQQKAATEAHTAAVQEQTAQMKRNEDLIRAQGPALLAALTQMINGGIGGNAGLGRQYPSSTGLGGLARA